VSAGKRVRVLARGARAAARLTESGDLSRETGEWLWWTLLSAGIDAYQRAAKTTMEDSPDAR
jgi:hypothetical protein